MASVMGSLRLKMGIWISFFFCSPSPLSVDKDKRYQLMAYSPFAVANDKLDNFVDRMADCELTKTFQHQALAIRQR